jgi:hypothetical protein
VKYLIKDEMSFTKIRSATVLVEKPERKRYIWRFRLKYEDSINFDLAVIGCDVLD